MDYRLTHFTSTDQGSGIDWESETEGTIAITPSIGFRPAGMSDNDWGEDDLDVGYHPTSIIDDEPPPVGEEQIQGAQDTPTQPKAILMSCRRQPPKVPLETLRTMSLQLKGNMAILILQMMMWVTMTSSSSKPIMREMRRS